MSNMMWLWKRRERFSLDELRFLTEQLQRTTYVNEYNKDSVVETLRSIAELMIWGDQRDASFFEYFMEKQVMVLFLQILELGSTTTAVAVQLLQSVSIMIQNIRSDHAIYYIFSNGYLNHFITYPFDFRDEELLAYYISFLRTTSTKLDQTTISFFITTENNEIASFPLYTEGIKFFRHEESMVRIAVRTLTLNVYHVNDKSIREFVTSKKVAGYFSNLVKFLSEKAFALIDLVASVERTPESTQSVARLEAGVAETEEILDYCNDIVSAGIPDLARAMTEDLMHLFVVPLLCSLSSGNSLCAVYLLFRILYSIKHKPLANGIAAALICEDVNATSQANGAATSCPMEAVLDNLVTGNDMVIAATVALLLCLLHSEVDESILDVLGLLPRQKQHRRRLLQTLMGSKSDEDLLFSSHGPGDENLDVCDYSALLIESEKALVGKNLTVCNDKNKEACDAKSMGMRESVVRKLLQVLCRRPSPSGDALWECAILLWQIFPQHQEDSIRSARLEMISTPYLEAKENILKELDDCWCDCFPSALCSTWKTFQTALEESKSPKEAKAFLLPSKGVKKSQDSQSSTAAAERMQATLQMFVALHQLKKLLSGESVAEAPPLDRGLEEESTLKSGFEFDLSCEEASPCRVAFEKGREEGVYLLPKIKGTSGWLLLAVERSSKPGFATARVVAPLAGCLPAIDEDHPKWLHLRIRPPKPPTSQSSEGFGSKLSRTRKIDGRWTLAFSDGNSCKLAMEAVVKAMVIQRKAVHQALLPVLGN